jgi:hypothetical protein
MIGQSKSLTRITAIIAVAAGLAIGACTSGCQSNGDFSLFGYTTAPPYDPSVQSVYIPVFKNITFHTSPHRGIEADITQAIVDELNRRRSPIRVVSDCDRADTELVGSIVQILKVPQNRNLQNMNREFDIQITVEVVWRDLRSGRVLTGSRQPSQEGPPPDAFDPSRPPPAPPQPVIAPAPVQITAIGRSITELGESNTTAQKAAVDRIARQIVNMMEQPW